MKSLRTLFIILLINACLFLTQTALACHKGGAMGMASEDPLNSTMTILLEALLCLQVPLAH